MDRQLIRRIENDYPYPIALEFRRLNTKEYLANDENRLRQILKISETTIHLLALISVVDLLENSTKSLVKIPDSFKRISGLVYKDFFWEVDSFNKRMYKALPEYKCINVHHRAARILF